MPLVLRHDVWEVTDLMTVQELIAGHKYLIRHRAEGQRYDRTSVMRYLGEARRDYIFDSRPVFGNVRLSKSWVISVEEVPAETPIYCNRRV